jgi:hypothetical protein
MNHVANSAAAFIPPARVIDCIYDAALDASGWPDAVAEISGAFNGLPTAALVNDAQTGFAAFRDGRAGCAASAAAGRYGAAGSTRFWAAPGGPGRRISARQPGE